jgi:hypothetical protein
MVCTCVQQTLLGLVRHGSSAPMSRLMHSVPGMLSACSTTYVATSRLATCTL